MASFVSIFSTSTGSPNMRLYLQPVGAIAAAHTLLLFVTAALIVRGRAPFLPLSNSPHNPKIIVGLAFVALLGGTPSVIATIVLCKGDWPLVLIAVAKFGMLLWIAFTLFMIQRRKLWANERGAAWFHELLMVVMACIHICVPFAIVGTVGTVLLVVHNWNDAGSLANFTIAYSGCVSIIVFTMCKYCPAHIGMSKIQTASFAGGALCIASSCYSDVVLGILAGNPVGLPVSSALGRVVFGVYYGFTSLIILLTV